MLDLHALQKRALQCNDVMIKLIQSLANKPDLQLFFVLTNYYLDSLRPFLAELQKILTKPNIHICAVPIHETHPLCKSHFSALSLLRQAFIADLHPDVLIIEEEDVFFSNEYLVSMVPMIHTVQEAMQGLDCVSVNQSLGEKPGLDLLFKHLAAQPVFHSQPRRALQEKWLKRYAQCISINHFSRKPILYLDISFIHRHDFKTGIQRVVRSLVIELLKNPPPGYQVEPVFSVPNHLGFYFARSFVAELTGSKASLPNEPIEPKWGDQFLGLDFTGDLVLAQSNYLKNIYKKGVGIEFVVYDLLPLHKPKAFPPKMYPAFKRWINFITEFDGALCISAAVASELKNYLTKNPSLARNRDASIAEPGCKQTGYGFSYDKKEPASFNIRWFHLGADIENSAPTSGLPDEANEVLNKMKAQMTFLMVSTIEPRKGFALALSAFEKLWAQGEPFQLVMVGKPGWKVEKLIKKIETHPELNKRLIWLNGISDEFLQQIYHHSSCFLGLSEGEGFGLPLIEAARVQLPIIARNIPVFREIAQDHALYFNGSTADELSNRIREWVHVYHLNQHPRSDKMPWLTWSESAQLLKAQLILG